MAQRIIYISGGARSGKSRYAQTLAETLSDHPIYLATARVMDEDFARRVARHRAARGEQWETLEEPTRLSAHDLSGRVVLMDCVTLWLTNLYDEHRYDMDETLAAATEEWDRFIRQEGMTLIVVSNELGMGLHAATEGARHFVDLQGWVNQHIAATADEAYFMVSGLAMRLK